MLNDHGYDSERFVSVGDQFECLICTMIVVNPQECSGCGNLFCKKCIDDWAKKNSRECPNRCQMNSNSITSISKAMQRMYNNLDIKCINFNNCKTTLKLTDLEKHESICSVANCDNFAVCKKKADKSFGNVTVCSNECEIHFKLQNAASKEEQLRIIQQFKATFESRVVRSLPPVAASVPFGSNPPAQAQRVWKWDSSAAGTGIRLFDNGTNCFLQESSYMFRTIIGDTAMNGGQHYWEIHADPKTENELKIGLTNKKDFNYNSAFCDFDYGYAYYGLGQLRHGSNASGPQYGKRFKKEGVLGIYLNMTKGTLSFALNGEFFGVAFTDDNLKRGPIYPAVSLLHQAGCTIKSGLPTPNYFQNC